MNIDQIKSDVCKFFTDLHTDAMTLYNAKPADATTLKTVSVVCRILGAVCVLGTATSLIAGISTVASAPLAALSLLMTTIFGIVMAHDLLAVGRNCQENFISKLKDLKSAVVDLVYDRPIDPFANKFDDTWVLKSIYEQLSFLREEPKF